MKQKIITLLFCVLFALFPLRNVFADMGPSFPSCYNSDSPKDSSCGILNLSVNVDVSSLVNKFVFVQDVECNGSNYSVADSNILKWDNGRFTFMSFFAMDKDYFQNNGGIDGIFNTTEVSPDDDYCGQSADSKAYAMEPKNQTIFKQHAYNFIVSKDDENLYVDKDNLILLEYVNFSGGIRGAYYDMAPKETSNLSCTLDTCSAVVTYTPQTIVDNYILLAPTNTLYNPPNADKFAPYIPQDKGSTPTTTITNNTSNSKQNIVIPPNNTQQAPEIKHISWIGKIWNSITSFFRGLFKK